MKYTVRSASSSPTTPPSRPMRGVGYCSLYVWGALPLLRSLSITCELSSGKGPLGMPPTARTDSRGHSTMVLATSLHLGLNYRRPSPRSRSCYQSRSWMATPRLCWRTRQLPPGNCATSSPTK
uniref:Uncharacterized protein n=1 Tax=Timema douglasi TaxID=61478 RepID=A0A7R8ZIH9_TIMDO|nr:unnamed protein product [Timema douglasi]